MSGRLDRIESMLRAAVGGVLFERCPEIVYDTNELLMRFGRTQDTLPALHGRLDSMLFNAIYVATDRQMLVAPSGVRRRITTDEIRDLADRLLSLAYCSQTPTPELQALLFDFSREGSFAAMRTLAERFPLDPFEREYLLRVLEENDQTA